LPPTSWSTFGRLDFSRVPLPAAMMATATRGAAPEFEDVAFFIALFICFHYIVRRWRERIYEAGSSRRSQTQAAVDGKNLAGDELRRGGEEQDCSGNLVAAPILQHGSLFGHAL
jgi:hypothetical protein